MTETSLAERLAEIASVVPNGHEIVARFLSDLSTLEAAAFVYDWEHVWRRPKQAPPPGPWLTWGDIGGRGTGKTISKTQFVHREIEAGRAPRVALIAQNEDRAVEVLVEGQSGLVTISPPWFRARYEAGRVVYPNGGQAFIYTPERPGDIFGPEHHLALAEELHAWAPSKREEAFANLRMGLRLGYGRLIWNSNPAKRHPLLRDLIADAEADPVHHVLVKSTSLENRHNLTPGVVEEWIRKYGHTQRGREMIYGEMFEDAEGALWQQAWIDAARRSAPDTLKRRVLSIDPAISMRAGTDATGICDAGLGHDGQVYVLGDLSKHLAWEAWGDLAVKRYFAKRCDCIVIERNRGADACVANIRARADKYGRDEGREIRVEVVKADAVTRHAPSAIYVKEVIGRASKGTRAEPVASHYEAGRVSHADGVDLSDLEDLLTTWIPDEKGESPNALDALVYAVLELGGLSRAEKRDTSRDIEAAAKMQQQVVAPKERAAPGAAVNVMSLLLGSTGRGGGDRI